MAGALRKPVDSTAQRIFHALIESGALGKGLALSELGTSTADEGPTPLVYRTKERDWVLVASQAASRQSFLSLAEVAMAHALDHEGVTTETGIACESIDDALKAAADRLNINIFEVKPTSGTVLCGLCGGPMNDTSKGNGWGRCQRCVRLFGDLHEVHLCSACLTAFGAVPTVEEKLKELSVDTGSPWPVTTFCPACRAPDRPPAFEIEILVKGVTEGRLSLDRLKEAGIPKELLQLINLRVQAKR